MILGTMMVGQATAFAPNYNKAVLAAARVFRLLDRKPLIDAQGHSGLRLVLSKKIWSHWSGGQTFKYLKRFFWGKYCPQIAMEVLDLSKKIYL